MKDDLPGPIPIPLEQRWLDVRVRFLPVIVFLAAAAAIGVLWKQHAVAPTMVGQAEPVTANVSCQRDGVLAELNVNRFQKVKLGDPVGRVLVADPKVLLTSLAVIQAEIELLRVNLAPISGLQRTAMDFDHLQLVLMRQRADNAAAKANLQLAEAELRRMEELFKDKIISERTFDEAKAKRDRFRDEVAELDKLVDACEAGIRDLQVTNTASITKVTGDPLTAAIAVQEAKLRQTEAQLNPVVVRAPMDGIVTTIFHRPGEAVTPGLPIVAIAALIPTRIIGYLRAPIAQEPKIGAPVLVRTRGQNREAGKAQILEVGTQFESIPSVLLGPVNFANIIQGLPVNVSLPHNLKVRPGEIVDITFAK
jgi:multidrug resistance efflux pump